MNRILVTPRSLTSKDHPALDLLDRAGCEVVRCTPGRMPEEKELLSLVPGCTGWLAGVEPITARVLEAAADLRVISRNGTGIDNIDQDAARRLGVEIRRTPGANARGVAELTLGLMLCALRHVAWSDRTLKAGGWERRKGDELLGKTVGIVGCGAVGRMVAEMCLNLDMRVAAYDICPDETFAPSGDFCFVELAQALAEADILSLHAPCTSDGKPLVTDESIARMKDGVLIVNTARAMLVDEEAVRGALDSGKVSGYASDVFAHEPPEPGSLHEHERVVATPHVGGFTTQSVDRAATRAAQNILDVLEASP
jgi:phosphoglycerate dehydrogenase-like enzyme